MLMTVDDELILALLKPEKDGKVSKEAPIIQIVGSDDIEYKLEQLYSFYRDTESVIKKELTYISPDIVVSGPFGAVAIELENDVQWDFMESIRQVKDYKHKFGKIVVIIPKEFERFAPLYKNEGFSVYVWKATRKWQCMKCREISRSTETLSPKCSKCNKYTKHRFIEIEDAKFEEFK